MGTLAYFAIFLDSLGGALGVAVDTEETFGTESDGAGGAVVLEAGLAESLDAEGTALLDLRGLTDLMGAGFALGLVGLGATVLEDAGLDLVLAEVLVLGFAAVLAAAWGFVALGLALATALADVLLPAATLAEAGVDLVKALALTLALGAADFVSGLAFGGALAAGFFAATGFFTLWGVAFAVGLTLLATTVFFTSNLLAVLNALISITWAKHRKTRGASERHTL